MTDVIDLISKRDIEQRWFESASLNQTRSTAKADSGTFWEGGNMRASPQTC